MTATIPERVALGAAWLDKTRPGWRDAVRLDELDMADGCKCVCGQVFASEVVNSCETGFGYATMLTCDTFPSLPWAEMHGFTVAADPREYGLAGPEVSVGPEVSASWEANYKLFEAACQDEWALLECEWKRVIHQGPAEIEFEHAVSQELAHA